MAVSAFPFFLFGFPGKIPGHEKEAREKRMKEGERGDS
jgi:hypothetical protein